MHTSFNLGAMHAASFVSDPKHLGFVLRRYHFVARMLQGDRDVLEVGCGDCTGAQIVLPVVRHLEGCDPVQYDGRGVIRHHKHDMLDGPLFPSRRDQTGTWDVQRWGAVYALDVLEHVRQEDEDRFLKHIVESLDRYGIAIFGMPSRESQPYASALSKQHHVNCKTEDELRATMERHFHAVFMFGLNDYTLHDGFGPLCHYRLALCVGGR